MPSPGSAPRLVCAALVFACALSGCRPSREAGPPDVVIVTVDTLRADHVGVYVPGAGTPRIDAFAREATVFEHCAAPMPLTRPSHFSLLTSLYPREHGVLNNAAALPDEAVTLPELLAPAGYRTAGFVGVQLLGPASGAGQGFSLLDVPEGRERRAAEVVERALAWVDGLGRDERYFAWVHFFDPHLPYDAPAPYGRVPSDAPKLSLARLEEIAATNGGDVPAVVLEQAKAAYRGEVAYVDHAFGELLDGLAARRSLDHTLIVFVADHGECFENGVFFEHADCLWEPGIHIPLIVRYPSLFHAGARVASQASIVDVAPTVLRAAGVELPPRFSGRALEDAGASDERLVLVQYPFYQPSAVGERQRRLEVMRTVAGEPTAPILVGVEKVGIAGRDWKYLRAGEEAELYALSPAPDERRNLAALRPEVAAELEGRLERELAAHPLHLTAEPVINDELRKTLEALGYL